MKWRRISRATKLLSRIFKILKILKNFQKMPNFFLFETVSPQIKIFKKNITYLRGQCLMNMCTRFQVDIFKNGWDIAQNMSKTGTFHVISGHYRDFPNFFFWPILTLQKVLGSFFAFFAKIWPKNMYRSSKSRFFFVWPFSPGDLRWPWPVLWSQSTWNDTYRCQWHYPCGFIVFVCA